MYDNGANYIDVGGESTRPGARRVNSSDEILRVMPSLQALRSLIYLYLLIQETLQPWSLVLYQVLK